MPNECSHVYGMVYEKDTQKGFFLTDGMKKELEEKYKDNVDGVELYPFIYCPLCGARLFIIELAGEPELVH